MSIKQPGTYLTGYDDLAQSIELFFRTPLGSIALHPELGSGIFEKVDRNTSAVIDLIRNTRKGLALWDDRYTVLKVLPIFETSKLTMRVTYHPVDDSSNIITIPIPIRVAA